MNFEIKSITKNKIISIFKNYSVLLFSIIIAFLCYFIAKYPPYVNYKLFNENLSLSSLIISILICIAAILPLIIFKFVYKYKFIPRHIQFIWLFATPLVCFFITQVIANVNMFSLSNPAIIFNYISYAFITFLIFALSGSVRFSIIISLILSYIFSLADTYVLKFRGIPLSFPDIFAYKTAANVASEYNFFISPAMVLTVIMIICVIILASFMSKKHQEYKLGLVYKILLRVSCLVFCVVCMSTIVTSDFLGNNYNIKLDLWNPQGSRDANGVYLNFFQTAKYLIIDKPTGYSYQKAQEIVSDDNLKQLSELGNTNNPLKSDFVVNNGEVPTNIIVIMNESLTDLNVLGDLQLTEDYMPFLHNLKENTIKGNVYVSQFGGGTANSEYEFLSGNSMAFCPKNTIAYQNYLRDDMSSLANILKTQNEFYTYASHTFYKSGWNREEAYEKLQFDEAHFIDTWPTPIYPFRRFPSDKTSYEGILNLLNNNDKNKFMMHITMQNHGGYNMGLTDLNIKPTNLSKDYPLTTEYINCVKESDNAFKELIEHYQNTPEPTIILMFGDHQPNIEPEFFEELLGKNQNELTLEELQKKYVTPFVMWANYDIPEMEIEQISLNYLSTLLMEYSNIELPPYNQFLQNLYQSIPVVNSNGYIDYNGVHHTFSEKNEFSDLINSYHILQYNDLFDKKNRVNSIFVNE